MTDRTQGDEAHEQAIAAFMARVSALPVTSTLPDPTHWCRAQLLERWSAERRVRLPITVMRPIEIAASLTGAVWLFYSSLSYLFRAYAG
ncbi:MAG TPA: hypothetical protein VKE51_26115 [Vicinamibacterales bacterium]|nr:hypothetical protein [Vicinamibacterales bacterium]